eukprot:TRINITY_DN12856_c0_g5_i1.p1 TRINITY_DN12856_c0_g5~~TRINITY_DN12856_c0_g5_i1.p1  ORF type:complete len:459 (+),score=114.02 TRINITY_DN12856_c0_g5_i1:154-1377(+)
MNPVCLANWQLGIGVPAGTQNAGIADNAGYQRTRKCCLCRLEIPKDWERLACIEGCDRSICCNAFSCEEKVMEAAREEIVERRMTNPQELAKLLNADSFLVREAAAEALRALGPEASCGNVATAALVKVLEHKGSLALEHGTPCSRVQPELASWKRLRVKAAHALAFIGQLHSLVEALSNSRNDVRVAAAWGIAEFAHKGEQPEEIGAIVQELRQALTAEHQHHEVCKAIVFAFKEAAQGSVAMAAAVPDLMAILDSLTSDHRRWQNVEDKRLYEINTLEALGSIGLPASPAIGRIEQRLVMGADNERSSCRRRTAALALGRIGATSELQRAAAEGSREVREAAAWALEQGTEADWPLRKTASDPATMPSDSPQGMEKGGLVDMEFGFSPTGRGHGGVVSFPEAATA